MSGERTRLDLEQALSERILVLDGAMGTMIQALSLDDADVMLLCIPFYHSYAIDMFSAALVGGCAVHVPDVIGGVAFE